MIYYLYCQVMVGLQYLIIRKKKKQKKKTGIFASEWKIQCKRNPQYTLRHPAVANFSYFSYSDCIISIEKNSFIKR